MVYSPNSYLDKLKLATGHNDVSRETLTKLEEFANLLMKWNLKINLVSKKINYEELWERHILDSAQLMRYIPANKKILDLGSGAGFPGLIIAIIGNHEINLVESDQRKCAFMREIVTKFHLKANIITARIEEVPYFNADIITARALAPLQDLLEYYLPFAQINNFMLLLKGQNVVEEINKASICWGFQYETLPNAFASGGSVLKISNVKRL